MPLFPHERSQQIAVGQLRAGREVLSRRRGAGRRRRARPRGGAPPRTGGRCCSIRSSCPALVNLANIHYERDELVEAEALYEKAERLDPECFEASFNLGNIHHDLARYPEAVTAYRDALAINPGYPEAHFYLAVTLEKLGRSVEAKPHWKQYRELAPDGEFVELAKEFSD